MTLVLNTSTRSTAAASLLQSLRVPVVAAPMFLITGPELVIEACRAGIVGAFPTVNARTVDELDAWMVGIKGALGAAGATAAPWAANLITHSTNQRLPLDLELVARHRPPLVPRRPCCSTRAPPAWDRHPARIRTARSPA